MNTISSGTSRKNLWSVALVAGIFEWYEFSVYGFLASIIGQLFFEPAHAVGGSLSAFLLFAFSYLARPLGGLFFGRMGDRKGRACALKRSLMTMALPTAMIGLLPTYEHWGFLATGLLCAFRLMQGFGMGGEFPNSISYIFDAAQSHNRTFYNSLTCASTSIGVLLGSAVIALLNFIFEQETILNGAWRLPFLIGIPLTLYIAYLRRYIVEPPAPLEKEHQPQNKTLLARLIAVKYKLLTVILLGGMMTLCGNLFLIWMPFYLTHFLKVPPRIAYFLSTYALTVEIAVLISSSYVVSRLGAQKLIKVVHIALLLLIYPAFKGLISGSYISLILSLSMLAIFVGSFNCCFLEVMGQLLPYDVRSLGTSIVFAVSPAILGGSAPLICTYLTHETGMLTMPALYVMAFGLIVLPFVLSLKSPHVSEVGRPAGKIQLTENRIQS